MKKVFLFTSFITLFLFSCKTADFDRMGTASNPEKDGYKSIDVQEAANLDELRMLAIEEDVKEVDIPKTIVYVDRPVYYPVEEPEKKVTGKDAAKKSTESAIQVPEKFVHGTMYYDFDEDFTYEIYTQPYRTTDLQLEPGEQVVEMPFLSEEKVWEIGAGVSRVNGQDTQHFFLKPAYSGLTTSFIIITDKRIYHLLLKSFKDCYMTQVKFEYPNSMPFRIAGSDTNGINKMTSEKLKVDPRYLSFDYKMTYSIFKKPYWLPYRVYDDGEKTYITMNETVLHMTSPVLMNHRNERINYWVDGNLIVINELIEKVTLRIGKQKVTIKKKNYVEPKVKDVSNKAADDEKVSQAYQGIHMPIVKQKAVENSEPAANGGDNIIIVQPQSNGEGQ